MDKPRRVTVLGMNYAPEPTGNAPYTTSLARGLAASGDEIHVVASFPHYPQWRRYDQYRGFRASEDDSGVDLRRLSHWIPSTPRGLKRLLSEVSFGLHQAAVTWKSPDVTVFVSPAMFSSALSMARSRALTRSKRVVWVQDLYSQGMSETGEGGGAAVRVATAVEGWFLRSADAVVAIHPAMKRRMVETLGVPAEQIHVLPNWSHISVTPVDRPAVRAQLGWREDEFIVLHAGNMGRKQGLANVVDAAREAEARQSSVRFVMLGDGAERAALEARAEGCTHITFVDPLDDNEFTAALQAADALLVNELPGVKEMAVPSKLTSYFASRRPVIAATEPSGIVASIMDEAGAGPVVQSGRPALLVDAAEALARDEAAADSAAAHGYAYFEAHLSEGGALESWKSILSSVTGA